jgi:hypothetical protein
MGRRRFRIATLTGSTVSTEGPIHASVIVTCQKAGQTTVTGNVTIGFDQQLTDKVSGHLQPAARVPHIESLAAAVQRVA